MSEPTNGDPIDAQNTNATVSEVPTKETRIAITTEKGTTVKGTPEGDATAVTHDDNGFLAVLIEDAEANGETVEHAMLTTINDRNIVTVYTDTEKADTMVVHNIEQVDD